MEAGGFERFAESSFARRSGGDVVGVASEGLWLYGGVHAIGGNSSFQFQYRGSDFFPGGWLEQDAVVWTPNMIGCGFFLAVALMIPESRDRPVHPEMGEGVS